MNTKKYTNPNFVTCPETTLKEVIDNSGLTKNKLIKKLQIPYETIEGILKGKIPITKEITLKLEEAFSIEANF